MSSFPLSPGPTMTMDPIGSGFVEDHELAAETEARAVLIANGLLADRPGAPTAITSAIAAGEPDLEIETESWEQLLCDDEWQALPDDSDPFEEVLRDEHRRRQLARLRVLMDELRETAPSAYRLMAMYWGLDGECVSTIAAIAHKLHEDQSVVECRVRDVMARLQDAMGVQRTETTRLRIVHAPGASESMVLPSRRCQKLLAA